MERNVGPIKSDLKIGLVSDDSQKIMQYAQKIEKKLASLKGIVSVNDGMHYGVDEIKLRVNSYGESLGLNEKKLGTLLSNFYLEKRIGFAFDNSDLLELKVRSSRKDSLEALKQFQIRLNNGSSVSLEDVADFHIIRSFEKVIKDNGLTNFYIYANVNSKVLTATEAIDAIKPILEQAKKEGIKIIFKGEEEKKELKHDMMLASGMAMLLIILSLLYLFNAFRETFMIMTVISFAFLGVLIGHFVMGLNLSMPSIIGMLGLSGVAINDGIIMLMNLKKPKIWRGYTTALPSVSDRSS